MVGADESLQAMNDADMAATKAVVVMQKVRRERNMVFPPKNRIS